MTGSTDVNRRLWDRWTEAHLDSEFYGVDRFLAGESTLKPVERAEIGDVAGKSLLHLQCHFGLDTLSWARLGAEVTGVDLSVRAVDEARALATRAGLDARFVAADVLGLPETLDGGRLDGTFDVVCTSYGVLDWLSDLDAWARVVRRYLAEDGVFHLVEFHPLLGVLGDDGRSFAHPYFPQAEPLVMVEKGSYAAPDADIEADLHVWPHSIGEILSALLGADLALDFVHEHPTSPYDCFPFTREIEPGRVVVPGAEGRLPMLLSLRARPRRG